MVKIMKEHNHSIAKLLTECFLEDQLVIKQTKGIKDVEGFLEKLFLFQLPIFQKTCEMFSLDDSLNSVIVGYEKNKYKTVQVMVLSILCQFKFLRSVKGNDLKIYTKNSREASKSIDLKWQNEFIRGNYYHIKIIAISKKKRGKGTFRELILPIANHCKEINIPIILETNTAENIPIYKHFGFEQVKTISKDGSDFCQYCLIKQP